MREGMQPTILLIKVSNLNGGGGQVVLKDKRVQAGCKEAAVAPDQRLNRHVVAAGNGLGGWCKTNGVSGPGSPRIARGRHFSLVVPVSPLPTRTRAHGARCPAVRTIDPRHMLPTPPTFSRCQSLLTFQISTSAFPLMVQRAQHDRTPHQWPGGRGGEGRGGGGAG